MVDDTSIDTARGTVAAATPEPNDVRRGGLMPKHSKSPRPKGKQQSDQAADYEVGYGRPPKHTRFKTGQSGNRKGRKRKPPSLSPDFKRLFDQVMSEELTITQGNKKMILTMLEAGLRQLARQHAQGDRHARREVIAYAERFGSDLIPSEHKVREGVAEAARSSPAYTLTQELIDRLSLATLDDIIRAEKELQAEKHNSNTIH
jgi:hypothetical protein